MTPLQVLVVDDEPLARASIRELLATDPEVALAGECASGPEARARIGAAPPDILFLDVQMPEVDGFQVLQSPGAERIGAVVFVTAHERYALPAFEVEAVDYLLKPFDDEHFHRTLERAKTRVRERRAHRLARELVTALGGPEPPSSEPSPTYLERLALRRDGKVYFLDVREIDWIEAADYCVRVHSAGRYHLHREPMKALETRLDPRRFFRIHRSAIVNLDRIKEVQPLFHGECLILLRDGTQLRVSRGRREQLDVVLGIEP